MTCGSCEKLVEKEIMKLEGVISVKADFSSQTAVIKFDESLLNLSQIKAAIIKSGYSVENSNSYKFMGILIIAAAIIILGLNTNGIDMDARLKNASYAVLFVVGLLTSIHCVGMCGGIMLSQSLSKEDPSKFGALKPALLYNLGRVLSYTVLGGIIGAAGSVISLSLTAKAVLQIAAGLFMIIMGLNLAGFEAFRKFQIKLPMSLCKAKSKSGSPFIVGILNGLMPCGPLQTMQLFALGTGSAIGGAMSMFVFSLGTVPLMLTFGALSGFLSKGYTKKILKFSGILIIVLGLIMGNRGLVLAGVNANPISLIKNAAASSQTNSTGENGTKAVLVDGVQEIRMTADGNGYTPNTFYVQKGIPVKWIIDGKALNSCNNAIAVKSLDIQQKLKSGENLIQFTPGSEDINFSCWMGMIDGVIKVVDDLDTVDQANADPTQAPSGSGSSCCSGGTASTTKQESIYGSDISPVATKDIIKKAVDSKLSFDGIGYELRPLIGVIEINKLSEITFNMTAFDNPDGEYKVLHAQSSEKVASFTVENGFGSLAFNPELSGGYAIVKDSALLGIIEAVDDLDKADAEVIRSTYVK